VRLTRARNLQAAIAYVLQAPPRDFFDFPSTHATTATVISVFNTVPRSLLRGPLGEALVDMREKTEEKKVAENCGLEAHLGGLCGACTAIFSSSCFS
jgi:hypothetical protein